MSFIRDRITPGLLPHGSGEEARSGCFEMVSESRSLIREDPLEGGPLPVLVLLCFFPLFTNLVHGVPNNGTGDSRDGRSPPSLW